MKKISVSEKIKLIQDCDLFKHIPQTKIPGMLYPTLFCDISDVDSNHIEWHDNHSPKKEIHNAIYDIPAVKPYIPDVFSTVTCWKPNHANDRTRGIISDDSGNSSSGMEGDSDESDFYSCNGSLRELPVSM